MGLISQIASPPYLQLNKNATPLLLLILIAVYLRLQGIGWGLPDLLHPGYSYHPDEVYHLRWANWLFHGKIISKHFMYGGTFYFSFLEMINQIGAWITSTFGGMELRNTILTGRLINLSISIATLLVCYQIATLLYQRRVALLAVMFLSLFPGHIFWASRVRPDELFTLMVSLNLLVTVWILRQRGNPQRLALGAGALLGLTIATRFPGALLAVPYLFALGCTIKSPNGMAILKERRLWLAILATIIGYLIASPYSLIHAHLFLSGLLIQWNYQSGPFVDAIGRGPVWFQYSGRILAQSAGYGFYPLLWVGLIYALWRRNNSDRLLLCWLIPYAATLAMASWVVVRYTLPLLPILAIFAAVAVDRGWHTISNKNRRIVIGIAIVLGVGINLATTRDYAHLLSTTDPRDLAANFLLHHTGSHPTILGFMQYKGDLFTNPPQTAGQRWSYLLLNSQQTIRPALENPQWDYLILPRTKLDGAQRLGALHPNPNYQELEKWGQTHPGYSSLVRFSNRLTDSFPLMEKMFGSEDFRLAIADIEIFERIPLPLDE